MLDWILVYVVVFFFVFIFQQMVSFFDPKPENSEKTDNPDKENLLKNK